MNASSRPIWIYRNLTFSNFVQNVSKEWGRHKGFLRYAHSCCSLRRMLSPFRSPSGVNLQTRPYHSQGLDWYNRTPSSLVSSGSYVCKLDNCNALCVCAWVLSTSTFNEVYTPIHAGQTLGRPNVCARCTVHKQCNLTTIYSYDWTSVTYRSLSKCRRHSYEIKPSQTNPFAYLFEPALERRAHGRRQRGVLRVQSTDNFHKGWGRGAMYNIRTTQCAHCYADSIGLFSCKGILEAVMDMFRGRRDRGAAPQKLCMF